MERAPPNILLYALPCKPIGFSTLLISSSDSHKGTVLFTFSRKTFHSVLNGPLRTVNSLALDLVNKKNLP